MAFSQKSTFSKMAATLNDGDMKSNHSELHHWASSIRDELDLFMAKGLEKEAQESTRFRGLSARLSRANQRHQNLAERIRILDMVSDYDCEITWKQTRKKGNTKTFTQTQEYRDWKDSSVSSTLVYTGKLGSGKSVMLANMVDDLTIHVEGTNAHYRYTSVLNTVIVPQPENKPDIEAFIKAELNRCINSSVLVLDNPGLKHEIQDALIKGSHGMFLWVTLQIYSVCSMMTDEEVRQALENLPQDLMQIYSQILERTLLPGQAYRAKIFKLVLVAKRPLTVDEIQEALSVAPGDTEWNLSKLLNDI
ncbi:hypothetical protein HRS9139_01686 [Pyrenophora teres f. teres]|nr:hypothetical protein HRS9139_01686 [Pyrenophora teres f. teres]